MNPTITTTTSSNFDASLQRMSQLFGELLMELRRAKEESDAGIQRAWLQLDRERAELRAQRPVYSAKWMDAGGGEMDPRRGGPPSLSRHDQMNFPSAYSNGFSSIEPPAAPRLERSADTKPSTPSHRSPFWITVWSGMHRNSEPRRVLLRELQSFQQLLEKCAKETMCRPAPRFLYTPDGCTVSSIDDLRVGSDYLILPSGCAYSEESVPTALLEKIVNGSDETRFVMA